MSFFIFKIHIILFNKNPIKLFFMLLYIKVKQTQNCFTGKPNEFPKKHWFFLSCNKNSCSLMSQLKVMPISKVVKFHRNVPHQSCTTVRNIRRRTNPSVNFSSEYTIDIWFIFSTSESIKRLKHSRDFIKPSFNLIKMLIKVFLIWENFQAFRTSTIMQK